jgi:hypothetical protein
LGEKEAVMAAEARVIDMSDLKDLAPLSPRINTATNELNQALESIQKQINDLALGVEVWLDGEGTELAQDFIWRDINDEIADYARTYQAQELGYGRHSDSWALLVRTMGYPQTRLRHTPEWKFEGEPFEIDRKPLLRSARHLRVKAVSLIPQLVDQLKAEAEKVIDAVEQAKRLAKSLK